MYQESEERWFFDDPRHGIVHEEMVLGADTLLTRLAGGARLTLGVSPAPRPKPLARLDFVRLGGVEEGGSGRWYRVG